MSPYHVQIDSLYFHIMKGSLLKGKQISSLPLLLQKQKFSGAVGSCCHRFFVYIKMEGDIDKN